MPQVSTTSTYDAALDVVSQGWKVIPVHAVDDKQAGKCTCRRAKCPHPGKHPWEKSWQESQHISKADCYGIWVEKYIGGTHIPTTLGHDVDINVGILTGSVSRLAGIDIDPRNGGYETLAQLEKEHGPLPSTRTVRSGSDGRHYYFQLPEGMKLASCKFGDGVDFLADGRMMIAPGSTSVAGTYTVHSDAPIQPIPQWAIDLSKKSDRSVSTEIVMAADLPCHEDLNPHDQMRYRKYAMKVIEDECDAYQSAGWGSGGDQLFIACCNILEILQSPWGGVDPAYARMRLETARTERYRRAQAALRFENGQLPDEVESTWGSAAKKVAGKGRPVPPDTRYDGVIMPPFEFGAATHVTKPSPPSPFMQPPDPNDFDGESPENVITEAETVAFEAAQAAQMAEYEHHMQAAVIRKAQELRVLERAKEYLKAEDRAAEKADSRSAVVSGLEFLSLVEHEAPPLWGDRESCLWASGESLMIVGPPGVGKSTLSHLLVWARLGIEQNVLDFNVTPDDRNVLYLAMDRPQQIARAMRRLLSDAAAPVLANRLRVRKGPLLADVIADPEWFLRTAAEENAGMIVIDSLKDVLPELSQEKTAFRYNQGRQLCLAEGIEWNELHHNRKAGAENKAPKTLDDVYGNRQLTAGAGSVISIWGQPGDTVLEISQLKSPSGDFVPKNIAINKETGRMSFFEVTTLEGVLGSGGLAGVTVREIAEKIYGVKSPDKNQLQTTRNKITRMVSAKTVEVVSAPFGNQSSGDAARFRWKVRGN